MSTVRLLLGCWLLVVLTTMSVGPAARFGPQIAPREYGVTSQNTPPMTMGERSIPSNPYARAPHAAWIPFFGVGNTQVQRDPMDQYDQEIRNLPDAYKDGVPRYDASGAAMYKNLFMDSIMIDRISKSQQFLITEVLPWRVDTTRMNIRWQQWRFNQHMLDRTPEQSVSRLLTSNQTNFEVGLVRYGIALMLEHGFMKTAKGRKNYEMNIQQIVNATVMTLMKGAWVQLLNVDHTNDNSGNHPEMSINNEQDALQIIERELAYFHILGKGPDAFVQLMESERIRFRERTGEDPDYVVGPAGFLAYARNLPKYYFPMVGSYKAGSKSDDVSTRMGGITFREVPKFNLGKEERARGPSERVVTTSNFLKWVRGNCPPAEFSSASMDIRTYDYDNNNEVPLRYRHALWATGWFTENEDYAGGGFGSGLDGETADGRMRMEFGGGAKELYDPNSKSNSKFKLSGLGASAMIRWDNHYDRCRDTGTLDGLTEGLLARPKTQEIFEQQFGNPGRKAAGRGRHQDPSLITVDTIQKYIKEVRQSIAKAKAGDRQPSASRSMDLDDSEDILGLGGLEPRQRRATPQGGEFKRDGGANNPDNWDFYSSKFEDDRLAAVDAAEREAGQVDRKDSPRRAPDHVRQQIKRLYDLGLGEWVDDIYSRRVIHRGETGYKFDDDEDFLKALKLALAAYDANLKDRSRSRSAKSELRALIVNMYHGAFLDIPRGDSTLENIRSQGAQLALMTAGLRERYWNTVEELPERSYEDWLAGKPAAETQVPNPKQAIHSILRTIPIEDADLIFFAEEHNLEPLVYVVGFRNIEWLGSSMVMLKAYGRAGITWQGEHSFEIGDDPTRKVHIGHFTLYATSVISNPELVQHAHAVMIHRYIRGGGTRFWDFNNPTLHRAWRNSDRTKADILCYGVHPGDDRFLSATRLDMTGKVHPGFGPLCTNHPEPLPSTAPLHAESMGIVHSEQAFVRNPFLGNQPAYQTMSFQAYQRSNSDYLGAGKWAEKVTLNHGHEGPDFGYIGSIKVFNGLKTHLRTPAWSPLAARPEAVSTGLATHINSAQSYVHA
jgi:hypothetical protein